MASPDKHVIRLIADLVILVRYLDALHYSKDGNFTLNQHAKKMDELDDAFTEGLAYYADSKKHEECKKKTLPHPELDGEVRTLLVVC